MKRFHVHMHVEDLAKNVTFYSALFNQQPARTEADYAKWMLEDPPVNFAISTRGNRLGVDHLGIQVDSADELLVLKRQSAHARIARQDEGETTCCYARSNKYWLTDPQGLAWEQFHTLDNIPVFSQTRMGAAPARCGPAPAKELDARSSSPAAVNQTTRLVRETLGGRRHGTYCDAGLHGFAQPASCRAVVEQARSDLGRQPGCAGPSARRSESSRYNLGVLLSKTNAPPAYVPHFFKRSSFGLQHPV